MFNVLKCYGLIELVKIMKMAGCDVTTTIEIQIAINFFLNGGRYLI